ncbi:glycosyltransferase [bacterium]|nr:glycosyltransferase [bacterium]
MGRETTRGPAPLLSLAVIVRNQASDLAELLVHHRDLYDEAVVVDTGSSDDSPGVAERLAGHVHRFPWNDDFSAARNHSLDHCHGQWILVLDCDERIDPRDFRAVRAACLGGEAAGFILEQRSYCQPTGDPAFVPLPCCGDVPGRPGAAGYVPEPTVRLFPGGKGLHYSGRVHESLAEALAEAGIPVRDLGIPVHHFGHLQGLEGKRRRTSLYGRLLRSKIREEGASPRACREMATQLLAEGRRDLARRFLEAALIDDPVGAEVHRVRSLLGRLDLADGRPEAARVQFHSALRIRPDSWACWADAVRFHSSQGEDDLAVRYLAEARRLFPVNRGLKELESQVFRARGR